MNEFKLAVSDELERLLRDRAQHEERLRSAQEQLRGFRDRERAMNEALVAAQQLRVDSRAQAEREAELVVREAKTEAERILERAHQEEAVVRERADGAARQFTAYVASFRTLLERHLGEVDGLQRRTESRGVGAGWPVSSGGAHSDGGAGSLRPD